MQRVFVVFDSSAPEVVAVLPSYMAALAVAKLIDHAVIYPSALVDSCEEYVYIKQCDTQTKRDLEENMRIESMRIESCHDFCEDDSDSRR